MNMQRDENIVPLLVPDVPDLIKILPWLEQIEINKHYTNFGPLSRKLNDIFAEKFDVDNHEVALVGNATLALELVLQSLDLKKNSKILIPTFTFVATATAVIRAGHQPVLADVDFDSWILTPELAYCICEKMTIDAVIPVATFGMPHDMKAWQDFEKKTKIPVIIDAAAAYGSQWLNGSDGTLVFSLHATKSLPAIEGALVVSRRNGLASKVAKISNFGINLKPSSLDYVGSLDDIGTNAKISEYHAAVCLSSLMEWSEKSEKRRRVFKEYKNKIDLASLGQISYQNDTVNGGVVSPTLMPILCPSSSSRKDLEKVCIERKIITRRWYQPLISHMDVLLGKVIVTHTPNALELSNRLLGLPFFFGIQNSDIERVISAIEFVFKDSN